MDPMTLFILAAIGGSIIQTRATTKAAKDAISKNREGAAAQQEKVTESRDDLKDTAGEYFNPTARQDLMDEKAAEEQQLIEEALGDNEVEITTDKGAISEKVLTDRANSAARRAEDASILAELTGRVDAPARAGSTEGAILSELGTRLNANEGSRKRLGRFYENEVARAGVTDQGDLFLGSLLQSLGLSGVSAEIMGGLKAPGTEVTPTNPYTPDSQAGMLWGQENIW